MSDTPTWISVGPAVLSALAAVVSAGAAVWAICANRRSKRTEKAAERAQNESVNAQKQAAKALERIANVQTEHFREAGKEHSIAEFIVRMECRGDTLEWREGGKIHISPAYRVHVENLGPAEARNVSVLLDSKDHHPALYKDLQQHTIAPRARDMIILRMHGDPPRLPAIITITWEDDSGEPREHSSALVF